jgi:hypothetical protein
MEGTELRINKKPVLTIKGQHRLVDSSPEEVRVKVVS